MKTALTFTRENSKENIQIYENDLYYVFFEDEGCGEIAVRTREKVFSYPRIETFQGVLDINIAATGNMTQKEFLKHLEILNGAKETMENILTLKSKLEKEFKVWEV